MDQRRTATSPRPARSSVPASRSPSSWRAKWATCCRTSLLESRFRSPAHLWWRCECPSRWTARSCSAYRLISDSGAWKDPRRQFASMRAALPSTRTILGDLNWVRAAHLREGIAQMYDIPGGAERLRRMRSLAITHAPGSRTTALLFLGWFAGAPRLEPAPPPPRPGASPLPPQGAAKSRANSAGAPSGAHPPRCPRARRREHHRRSPRASRIPKPHPRVEGWPLHAPPPPRPTNRSRRYSQWQHFSAEATTAFTLVPSLAAEGIM